MLRRAFLQIVSPSVDEMQNGPRAPSPSDDDKLDTKKDPGTHDYTGGLPLGRLMHLFHRVFEAHTLMCQVIVLIFFSAVIQPGGYLWVSLSSRLLAPGIGIHPHVELSLMICGIIQKLVLLPNIITLLYYYSYHQFAGFDRWVLQPAGLIAGSIGSNVGSRAFTNVLSAHRGLKVHALGRRAKMAAPLNRIKFIGEFAAGSVIAAVCFFLIPLLVAQTCQLVTKDLEYQVSEKPHAEEEVDVRKELSERKESVIVIEVKEREFVKGHAKTDSRVVLSLEGSDDDETFVEGEGRKVGGGDMRMLV
jgi:hypothetical protein